MILRSISNRLIVLATLATTVSSAFSAPYQKGDQVSGFQSETQHEQAYVLKPASVRYLLVSHDMDTGKKANAVLTTVGPDKLTAKKVVYVANIHGMPGIGRMFAMPKMRKYSHTIVLGDDAELIARFPEESGKVTVLTLEAGKVVAVSYWAPGVDALDDFIK